MAHIIQSSYLEDVTGWNYHQPWRRSTLDNSIERNDFTSEPIFFVQTRYFESPVEVSVFVSWESDMRRQSFATVLIGKNILVREGIAQILRAERFRILASVSSVDELPSTLQSPQPLFLIVQAGDDFDLAAEHIGLVRDQHPGGRIAIVANRDRPAELALAFRAGANGYFVNVNCCDAFIKSIELVAMGGTVFPPAFLSFALDTKTDHGSKAAIHGENEGAICVTTDDTVAPQLSPREKSILRCLIEGDSNKTIARKIDIAEATVKVHVKAILRKIRVQNRTQAAIWAMNHGALARAEMSDAPPSGRDIDRRTPEVIDVISNVKQIEAPGSRELINGQGNHVGVPRIASFEVDVRRS
ncbi:response regulator transcription factor [Bradyrhizobium sp. UFLA05-153]